ncbi:MAG TPA: TA system VapC family ribonuclease toxin [Solirubrobacterales bacterium]|nr:TA system VapC family ribonuclease toxin [Solirubrobacterales bacterium]
MILLDANILIYASAPETPQHATAKEWLDERLNDVPRVGMPWPSLLAFMRIVANPRLFDAASLSHAHAQVRSWLALPNTWIPSPTEAHARILGELLEGERSHRLVPDAHLAALALEHGLVMCSSDGDFARFPGLRWENPLR